LGRPAAASRRDRGQEGQNAFGNPASLRISFAVIFDFNFRSTVMR